MPPSWRGIIAEQSPPKGWVYEVIITCAELGAGRRHFKNYRDFLAKKGLPALVATHGLAVDKEKIVSGGNIGLFLLRQG